MALLLLGLTQPGCRMTVSALQEGENRDAPASAVVEGVNLTLTSTLSRERRDARHFDVIGELAVATQGGQLPDSLELYHMSLRISLFGAYVENFRLRNEGKSGWHDAPAQTDFFWTMERQPDRIFVKFRWANLRAGGDGSSLDHVDVSVSLTDSKYKRQILTNLKVPAPPRSP
jgi:hypothetical protein